MTNIVDRDALIGVVIAGGFGIGWAFWAASGLATGAASAVRISAVIAGGLIVASALVRITGPMSRKSADIESVSMFRSRAYLVSVTAELIAIVGGNAALEAAGQNRYIAAWVAFVVGVHFLIFGRLLVAMFYSLGIAFVIAALAGVTAGVISSTRSVVEASTGSIAAVSLFIAGIWGLARSVPVGTPPTSQ